MNVWISTILCLLLAWLIGSVPFSLLIARVFGGFDLRTRGSGNVGATNVARTMGAKWGTAALLLDALKGALPVWGLPLLTGIPVELLEQTRVLTGVAAILGHMFPIWLRFRGGKGVATALGVVVILAPQAMGIALLAFLVTFGLSRIVSLSSMTGAIAFAISEFVFFRTELGQPQHLALQIFSIAVPLLIMIRHWPNIMRLCSGEEKQLVFRKTSAPEIPADAPPIQTDDSDAA